MAQKIGDQFIEALRVLESEGDTNPMRQLFAEECTVWNVQMKGPLTGLDGADKFWKLYRSTFSDIQSEFTHREELQNCILLEWHSSGHREQDQEIEYDGATILEHDGEKITAFRSYFDTRAVSHPVETNQW